MTASHLNRITPMLVHAVLNRWKASDLVIEWLADEPPPDADMVWRVLDTTCLKGDSPEDVVDSAVGMACQPEGMQPGTVLRAETLNLTGETI